MIGIDQLRTFDGSDVEVIAERGSDFLRRFHQLRDGDALDVIELQVVRLLDPRVC